MTTRAAELHDSKVQAIRQEGTTLVLEMTLYIHVSDGAGYTQQADMRLEAATAGSIPKAPFGIDEGSIESAKTKLENLLELPFHQAGPLQIVMTGFQGEHLAIKAASATVILKGTPTYVEEVFGPRREHCD